MNTEKDLVQGHCRTGDVIGFPQPVGAMAGIAVDTFPGGAKVTTAYNEKGFYSWSELEAAGAFFIWHRPVAQAGV